jgi:RNA polymerase sigma-70 factor (ECF subfamily)
MSNEGTSEKFQEYDVEQLRAALGKLGNPCRELIELMYFNKLSQDEISQRMGYKDRDTVKAKKWKCIARLKKLLENPDDYETDIT